MELPVGAWVGIDRPLPTAGSVNLMMARRGLDGGRASGPAPEFLHPAVQAMPCVLSPARPRPRDPADQAVVRASPRRKVPTTLESRAACSRRLSAAAADCSTSAAFCCVI